MLLYRRQMAPCVAIMMATLITMTTVSARRLELLDTYRQLIGDQQKARDMKQEMERIKDPEHGVKMGVASDICDNGFDGIEIDWDPQSVKEITCYNDDVIYYDSQDISIEEDVPGESIHVCYPDEIHYNSSLPLSGPHRPLWPVYGEYTYLPPQRWVHSLEHGAIVFLYHPCEASKTATQDIIALLDGCLWKRVISPYREIPYNMPYAMLAFRHAFLFSSFDKDYDVDKLKRFIYQYAFTAPETHALDNGQYLTGLVHPEDEFISSGENTLHC